MSTVIKVILFLLWVNFLPPLANMIWGDRFNRPLDRGLTWVDGRPVFGRHKTIRGILCSLFGGLVVFFLLGTAWWVAGVTALLAMAGDLLSSFIKRRFNVASGKTIPVLDQIFESLFPLLFLSRFLMLSWMQIGVILFCFVPLAYGGSCFWNYICYRPPLKNYPRRIRSTVRFREWRACHTPLARWQTFLNLTSFLSNDVFLSRCFKLAGLYEQGVRNTLDVRLEEKIFYFPNLPASFDGFRLLLLTDLHLDSVEGLTEQLIRRIRDVEADLCLVGGDIRMMTYGPMAPCLRQLRRFLPHIKTRHGILAVLGNHDCIEMVPDFEEAGLIMLINDSWDISENGEKIWVVGVDDPHYYKTDDARQAFLNVPEKAFTIFLAHSPEAYKSASSCKASLYLCGHTHGGQICLSGGRPILTNSRAPRFTATGSWQYQGMRGYTSRGAGASSIPLRFNCPGEISLITLHRDAGPGEEAA